MTIFAVVLAILSLVVSAISLTWQVVQHNLSGARVKVELLLGAMRGSQLVSGPFHTVRLEDLADQGFDSFVVVVRGRNRGRMPVDVTGFDVAIDSGASFGFPGWNINPTLPHRLEPGSSATFCIPLENIDKLVRVSNQTLGSTRLVRGRLDLGTGQTVVSKKVEFPL
ncbi:hypothetical protein GCM10023350_06310 [Nocardioides endophyticus]|uniref:DUF4352 domain-containing protein n=1 Tax=Nocardioides endophyticus TaxID=1353775 RepID=A0ABP8YDL5_9ACTN